MPRLRSIVLRFAFVLAWGLSVRMAHAEDWQPGPAPLLTRWAAEVGPTNALPEYPRPQFVRADWLSLNGLWDYAITSDNQPQTPDTWEGRILVPYPIESALSGVTRRLHQTNTLWYRRGFTVPPVWSGRRLRLHFDAVDWQARVWVNGRNVGQHRGGFDRFTFDITEELLPGKTNELVVAVNDPTEGDQPRGKQSRTPEGIFYTPTSGIWQTVWLEPVAELCLDALRLVPDLEQNSLRLRAAVNTLSDAPEIVAVASVNGREIARISGGPNRELLLPIPEPRLWSPTDPFLYDLEVTLSSGGQVVDRVRSYFGMRSIALKRDERGLTRIALNGEFVFQIGTLDQGFWPDGLYTAPTDAALRSDIEFLKSIGFNVTRKHVKVEPDRWYYWCDRLGLLVWQDMPSGNNSTPEGKRGFETELRRMVEQLHNHPSIVCWVLFNEGWGQYDTARLVSWLKSLDGSRLVNNASGWTDQKTGDLIDAHSYPGPDAPPPETKRAAVLGEFGGIGLEAIGHSWSSTWWGYQKATNTAQFAALYRLLLSQVWTLHDELGLSAAIYTQTTDVETECNGLLTYDRAIPKLDPSILLAANLGHDRPPPRRFHVPDALLGGGPWRFTTETPPDDWTAPRFDDSAWGEGRAGFGSGSANGAIIRTRWNTPSIWLRRHFQLSETLPKQLTLRVRHDEDAEVFINGVPALTLPFYISEYREFPVPAAAMQALKPGLNTIAVRCRQTVGGQFIDVGLVDPSLPPLKRNP